LLLDQFALTKLPVNETLSIPLNISWTNSSVQLRSIRKSAPALTMESFLSTGDQLYQWGGQGPYAVLPNSLDLWRLNPDGRGGGSWVIEEPSNKDTFLQLKRTSAASHAVCGGAVFHLGGMHGRITDVNARGTSLAPGMLRFDLDTRTWTNESAKGYNDFGTSAYGGAVCIPNFGSKGVFLPIGGAVASPTSFRDDGSEWTDLENVSFYDVDKKTWFTQRTTGGPPRPRGRFCYAGAAGENGTYELYVLVLSPRPVHDD
jgi:hypothetical protein